MTEKNRRFCLVLLIVLLASLPFISLVKAQFVHWDDDIYVVDNDRVKNGITPDNIKWSFSTIYFGFYYPVTWLSHMLDCSIYGLWAGGHHLTNIILHIINSLLLFLFFRRTTSDDIKSFLVAAFFAVHPLNVESIAWISERKNLLAAFFFLLGMNLYLNYVKSPTAVNYIKLFACYLLGLMSKTILVTFPAALLIIDIWPLGRLPLDKGGLLKKKNVLYEKLLLLVPVPIFTYLTIIAQRQANALGSLKKFPLDDRIAGAVLGYAHYVREFFLPLKLAAFYPHLKNNYSLSALVFSIISLSAATFVFFFLMKKDKVFLAGWSWFLINLTPVIGIIQVGDQAYADRYMYIPMIGFLAMIFFGAGRMVQGSSAPVKWAAGTVAALALVLFIGKSHYQALTWKDTESLFTNMTIASPKASQGHYNMGLVFKGRGEYGKAIEYYKKAIECDPEKAEAFNNMGNCYVAMNRPNEALEAFRKASELDPGSPIMRCNLGAAKELLGDLEGAKKDYRDAIALGEDHVPAWLRLSDLLARQGDIDGAMELAEKGSVKFPDKVQFSWLKISILISKLKYEEALTESLKALALHPEDTVLLGLYGDVCLSMNNPFEAEKGFEKMVSLDPNNAMAHFKLAESRSRLNKPDGALREYEAACGLDGNNPMFLSGFTRALFASNQTERALSELRKLYGVAPAEAASLEKQLNLVIRP